LRYLAVVDQGTTKEEAELKPGECFDEHTSFIGKLNIAKLDEALIKIIESGKKLRRLEVRFKDQLLVGLPIKTTEEVELVPAPTEQTIHRRLEAVGHSGEGRAVETLLIPDGWRYKGHRYGIGPSMSRSLPIAEV
jgi:hypothetical protein